MPDETLGNETETEVVTEPEGSDSQTAESGDNAGASAESPTAGSKKDGDWVPRSRLNEVIEERNHLRETLSSRVADQWQQFQAAKQEPEKPKEPLFDEDTDRRLEQYLKTKMGGEQQLTQAQIAQVRAELNEIKVAKANKDWDTMKPEVLREFDQLRQSGFSGPSMTQALIDALRYRSGAPMREAVEQARRREDTKMRVAGPAGRAEHEDVSGEPDFDKMSPEDFNKFVGRVLRS